MKAAWAVLAALLPAPALAQAYQCTVPQRLAPLPPVRADGPVRKVPVGGYTLAASWSPEYCRNERSSASMQCSGRHGRFGFILHGLWPEARSGPPPQWCALTPRPSSDVYRRSLCTTPVPGLIEHEWAKHGSCMATTPEAYWGIARHVWGRFRWPDADRLSRKPGLVAGDLRVQLMIANPGLAANQIGVHASPAGWLREVRICHNRALRPIRCRSGVQGLPDSAPLKIWRGL
ncbi:MAG: ribonuclease T [Pseudomonadota bacterium]